MDRDR